MIYIHHLIAYHVVDQMIKHKKFVLEQQELKNQYLMRVTLLLHVLYDFLNEILDVHC